MPVLLLTPSNCKFIKHALRAKLSQVKSAHLTEALASTLGFRTNASLLTTMGQSDARRPPLVHADPSRLIERLRSLGYRVDDASALVEIVRAPHLPARVWLEFRNRDIATNNTWFRECEIRNIPNIYIELRTKYAKVNWDCISIDPRCDSHVREDNGSIIVDLMFRRYQALAKNDPGKSEFFGSAFVGSIDRLLPSVARDIADDFFMHLYSQSFRYEAAPKDTE